jgi:membrane protease YdiL (CAAX protease family)
MTPAVYAVQSLAVRIWRSQQHPVEQMVLDKFSVGIAILAVASTIVLAPMIEELLFRGIVQRWLARLVGDRPRSSTIEEDPGSPGIPGDDFEWEPGHPLTKAVEEGEAENKRGVLVHQGASPGSSLPIVLTSVLFATMHLPQWPAPIAIFLLSMALGRLFQRTGSLIAVATMHATFNGFSTLLLLLEALSRQLQPHQAAPQAGIALASLLSALGL